MISLSNFIHFLHYALYVNVIVITICHCSSPETPVSVNEITDNHESQDSKVFVSGTKELLASNNLGGNSMDGAAIDIDGDDDIDLIIAKEFERNVILINNGQGVLNDESNQRFPNVRRDSEDIATGDFDNDGDVDIIFVSEDDETNEYYINNGGATFSDQSHLLTLKGVSNAVETFDVNNDSFLDLVIGNRGQNYCLINDGTGRFSDETENRIPFDRSTTQDLEVGDLDGDGDLDIVEANEDFNRILINDGSGVFSDQSSDRIASVNDQTREVDLGDIDNDGDLDIFFSNVNFGGRGNPQNRLLINDGRGYFNEITDEALPSSQFATVDSDFHDFNKDGHLDILVGNRFNGTDMMVLINNGNNQFDDQSEDYLHTLNIYPFDFQLADFNNDGLTDIYLCNFRGGDEILIRSAR